jgi:hypothetical protein
MARRMEETVEDSDDTITMLTMEHQPTAPLNQVPTLKVKPHHEYSDMV